MVVFFVVLEFSRIEGTEERKQVALMWIHIVIIMILIKVTVKSQSQRASNTDDELLLKRKSRET